MRNKCEMASWSSSTQDLGSHLSLSLESNFCYFHIICDNILLGQDDRC